MPPAQLAQRVKLGIAALALALAGGGAAAQGSGGYLAVGGTYNSTPVTLTNGFGAPIQLDANGWVNVHIQAGAGSGGTASTFGAAFPSTGTAIGVKNGANMVNLAADGSSNLLVNCAVGCAGGTTSNATSGVATSSTNGANNAWTYGFNGTTWDQLQVDASKFLKVTVSAALPAGAALLGKAGIDQTTPGTTNAVSLAQIGATTVLTGAGASGAGAQRVTQSQDTTTLAGSAPGTAGTPSANVVSVQGEASMTPVQVTQVPATAGGLTQTTVLVPANTTSVALKASAGQLYHIHAYSVSATSAPAYLKLYNTAQGSVTCGTTNTVVAHHIIPSNGGSAGTVLDWAEPNGIPYSTAITYCVTLDFADVAGPTSPAASTYAITFSWK